MMESCGMHAEACKWCREPAKAVCIPLKRELRSNTRSCQAFGVRNRKEHVRACISAVWIEECSQPYRRGKRPSSF